MSAHAGGPSLFTLSDIFIFHIANLKNGASLLSRVYKRKQLFIFYGLFPPLTIGSHFFLMSMFNLNINKMKKEIKITLNENDLNRVILSVMYFIRVRDVNSKSWNALLNYLEEAEETMNDVPFNIDFERGK